MVEGKNSDAVSFARARGVGAGGRCFSVVHLVIGSRNFRRTNSLKNGLLTVILAESRVTEIMRRRSHDREL